MTFLTRSSWHNLTIVRLKMSKDQQTASDDGVVITEENFGEYFFDVRMHKPQRGQVMARYTAVAEFIDGPMKQDIIGLLLKYNKAEAATKVLRKLGCATEKDSIRVCKEIVQDLMNGMTPEEVEKKPYEYTMEAFFYTKKEYVPIDDPHWSVISIANLDTFLDAAENKIKMKATLVEPSTEEEEE